MPPDPPETEPSWLETFERAQDREAEAEREADTDPEFTIEDLQ